MMKNLLVPTLLLALSGAASSQSFDDASETTRSDLKASLEELSTLREQMASEKIPLSRELSEVEAELRAVRDEYQATTRLLDSRTLDLSNLHTEIEARKDEESYLSDLLAEYLRNFDSRLHIAESKRYEVALQEASLAVENSALTTTEVYQTQASLLATSIERLEEAMGGTTFEGQAVAPDGLVTDGTFLLVGPAALFATGDGAVVGTAEQRLGSLEPTVVAFHEPLRSEEALGLVSSADGTFPFDPTLGNAHKMAATEESFLEHVLRGGAVMYPIFALAGAALLVALYKWLALSMVRKPSRKKVAAVLAAVRGRDQAQAAEAVSAIKGPAGRMLATGVEHMHEPRDLVEEVMYEKMLTSRLKLERMLPFISISAASAPLLGLLGTVTGIINTFKLITVFGSGDVKSLSGGISEALITTECGLIVAIPSLLMHAFLSRKARGIVSNMETTSVAFVNELSKAGLGGPVERSEPQQQGTRTDEGAHEDLEQPMDELLVTS